MKKNRCDIKLTLGNRGLISDAEALEISIHALFGGQVSKKGDLTFEKNLYSSR